MSLLVWLPLIDDVHNQGLSSVEPEIVGTVTNVTGGKIGKCYQFGTAAGQISLPVDDLQSCAEMSVAFWVKVLTWQTSWMTLLQIGKGSSPWGDYVFGFLRSGSASRIAFVIGNGSSTTTTYCQTGDLELNTWYHIAGVYSPGKLSLYVNGELASEYSTTIVMNTSVITKASIGRINNGSYQSNCLMNDFRLYDHALSAREVKELAKGLVAHWKLDDLIGGENLLPKTSVDLDGLGTMTTYRTGTRSIDSSLTYNGKKTIRIAPGSNTTSSGAYNGYGGVQLSAGVTYCYSCMVYSSVDDTFDCASLGHFQTYDGSVAHNRTLIRNGNAVKANTWTQSYITFTPTVDCAFRSYFIYFANTSQTLNICDVKLEVGDHPTPWTPAKSDTMYSDWELGKAHDSSGYGHDGTTYGSPEVSTDTPRYSVCTKMVNGSHFEFTNMPTPDKFTIAFWAVQNTGTGGYMVFGYSNGNRLNLFASGSSFFHNTGDSGNNPFQDDSGTTVSSSPYKGSMHHYAITGDGTQNLLYIDGVRVGKSKTYKGITGTTMIINGWLNTTAYNFNGNVSDFRFYATALSADDIKELYTTSASIDDHHNVYARELVEE